MFHLAGVKNDPRNQYFISLTSQHILMILNKENSGSMVAEESVAWKIMGEGSSEYNMLHYTNNTIACQGSSTKHIAAGH